MTETLSPELFWVAAAAALTALLWLPYIANQIVLMGLWGALKNSDAAQVQRSTWARRAASAHTNAIENLAVFAPLAIVVHVAGASTEGTATACAVYFALRVAHYIVHVLGVPVVRTLAFAGGAVCQLYLAAEMLM